MRCGGGGDLSGDTAETLFDKLLQRPARAVSGEHRKIVQVDIGIAVSVCDLVVIHFGKPIVCGDRAGVRENKSADGISDRGVFFYAPIVCADILIYEILIVEQRVLDRAKLLMLTAVQYVRLCDLGVIRLNEHLLNAVLNVLDGDCAVLDLRLEISRYLECKEVYYVLVVLLFACVKCKSYRVRDFCKIKFNQLARSFSDFVHYGSSFLIKSLCLPEKPEHAALFRKYSFLSAAGGTVFNAAQSSSPRIFAFGKYSRAALRSSSMPSYENGANPFSIVYSDSLKF